MINHFDIGGKTAFITGSSRGIGLALARALSDAGAKVILNGRSKPDLELVTQTLLHEGRNACYCQFDITDAVATEKALLELPALDEIDILINNAGIQVRNPLEDFLPEDWDRVIRTNLTGAFNVSRVIVRSMIKKQAGKIINICSLQSELARPTIAPYAAAKGGLKMLTRSMTVEWAKHNIQVNGIGPGYFATEMTMPLVNNPEFDSWIRARTPAHRWGRVEELSGVAVFLASSASSFINGQIIYVDGGIMAGI